jgi:outer membrane protein assembly factor BamB
LPPLDDQGVPLPAPTVRCGPQRPPLNAAPAFAEDGTVFVVSRAHRAARTSFVVAVRPDLTPRWAASFRGRLTDGCGVLRLDCNPGAPAGVDPGTGTLPAGMVDDLSTSSPVALPDGGVLYGAYTGYNGSRGHLFRFGAGGEFLASYDFGWDITPAVFPHGGTWSVVLKDNHYPVGPYHLTQLDAELRVEWQVANPETRSCRREENGAVTCLDTGEHPLGFEWCVNAVAVDREGVVYANAEVGFLYAIDQGGRVWDRIFLSLALGSAYTPVSLDAEGRIYAQNDGKLFVVGRRGPTRTK